MNKYQQRIPDAVPVTVTGMHRVFWVPPRYIKVATVVYDGRPMTIRTIASRTGYSVKGAWSALRAMERMGLGVLRTSRGWAGRTRFRVQDDVVRANVSTTVPKRERTTTPLSSLNVAVQETFARMGLGTA
jgi:DNA-binding transcriptional regulator GbsR (MarR family)